MVIDGIASTDSGRGALTNSRHYAMLFRHRKSGMQNQSAINKKKIREAVRLLLEGIG